MTCNKCKNFIPDDLNNGGSFTGYCLERDQTVKEDDSCDYFEENKMEGIIEK